MGYNSFNCIRMGCSSVQRIKIGYSLVQCNMIGYSPAQCIKLGNALVSRGDGSVHNGAGSLANVGCTTGVILPY